MYQNYSVPPGQAMAFAEAANWKTWKHFGKREAKIIEEPVIIWKKEYETDQKTFFRLIQTISDYMLLNKAPLYQYGNPNRPYIIDTVAGRLRYDDYLVANETWGVPTSTPVQDFNFYYPSKSFMEGEVISQPFKFHTKNVSVEFHEEQVKKKSKQGAKLLTNLMIEYAMQQHGVDLSGLQNADIDMSGSPRDIFDRLNGQEKMENILHKLLTNIHYENDILDLFKTTFSDRYDVNAEFAFIDVIDGKVVPLPARPDQVSWISPKRIKTLRDRSVIAACFNEYKSFTEILNEFGNRLNTGTGAQGLKNAMKKIQEGQDLGYYYPDRDYTAILFNQFTTRETSDPQWQDPGYPVSYESLRESYSMFYPFQRGQAGVLNYSALVSRIYFDVIKNTRYVVEFDGKKATQSTFDKWLKEDYNRELDASFIEIEEGDKPPKGSFWVEKPKRIKYEATRIGCSTFIDVGVYKYRAARAGKDNYSGMPIVGRISYKQSYGLLGKELSKLYNMAMNRIQQIVISTGRSKAVLIDDTSGIEPMSFMHNARTLGFAMYNSSKMAGAGPAAAKHLTMIELGNDTAEVQNLMTMAGMFTLMFGETIGITPQRMGIPQPYSGARETQINNTNQSTLSRGIYHDHSMFRNDFLQTEAEIAKVVYANDESYMVTVSGKEKEYLKSTSELSTADFDIYYENGEEEAAKKVIVNQAVQQVLSSGGVGMVEPLIKALLAENSNEALAIFEENRDLLLRLQQEQQQQAAQQAQQQAELQAQKNAVPIEVAKVNQETTMATQQMKDNRSQNEADFRGMMNDIQHVQDQQDKYLDANLHMDEETHRKALEERGESNDEKPKN